MRRGIQLAVILAFAILVITTSYRGGREVNYPINIFISADPLIALITSITTWELSSFFFPALIVFLVTLLVGRFFCGWLCPLGATLDFIRPLLKATRRKWTPSRNVKYFLLFMLFASALLSLNVAGFFDPMSIMIRSFSIVIYPIFSLASHALFEFLFGIDNAVVSRVTEVFYRFFSNTILPFRQGFFSLGLITLAIFLGIIAAEKIRPRFWCRYLCPLGALLSLTSGFSLLKRKPDKTCARCASCRETCEMDAFDEKGRFQKRECILTLSCVTACEKEQVRYFLGLSSRQTAPSLSRRYVIASLLSGFAIPAALAIAPRRKIEGSPGIPRLIRPPGAKDERDFLKRCVRCGECMSACPTGGLEPDIGTGGIESIYTPVLVPRIGYCEYHCTLCGQVCPTDAIRRLTIHEKHKTIIGRAYIDTSRCLPHAFDVNCAVCEEHCPTFDKAIIFKESNNELSTNGEPLKKPYVINNLCVGCGICEAKCPVIGDSAITVIAGKMSF